MWTKFQVDCIKNYSHKKIQPEAGPPDADEKTDEQTNRHTDPKKIMPNGGA